MLDAAKDIILGIFILMLSLIMWKAEQNFWAWLALFIPGSFYVILGAIKGFRE